MSAKRDLAVLLILTVALISIGAQNSTKRGCNTSGIMKLAIEIVQTHNVDNTIVLFYDKELESRRIHMKFIEDLHMLNRVVVMINLGESQEIRHKQTFGTAKQSSVLRSVLQLLYNRGKSGPNQHYTFIIWVSNPTILYTDSSRLHPGWKRHDRVILVYPENFGLLSKDIPKLQFWKHIPYIVGLKQDHKYGNINVFTVYPYCGGKSICYENLDVWSVTEDRFYRGGLNIFPDKFTSFYGAPLSAGIIWKEPFFIWGSKLHPYLDGLDWRLSKLVEKKLNTTIMHVHNEKFGRLENNSWTGMFRYLSNGTIDFALGGIAFTPERSKYFDFSRTYYVDSYTFISPTIKQKTKIRNIIMKPFRTSVWYHIVGAELFTAVMLYIIANIERKMSKKLKFPFAKHDEWFTRFGNVTSFAITQMFQKPCNRFPRSAALCWICHLSSLAFYILGIVFITHLISNMTSPKIIPSVDKSSNIIHSGIPLDIRDYEAELGEYLRSKRPELWKHATLVNWLDSCQSIKRVSRGTKIYMDTRSRLSFYHRFVYNKTRVFSFHISSENILPDVNLAWAMQKNWPFRRAFDRILSQAVESGLVHYWMGNFRRGRTAWDGNTEAMLIDETAEFLLDWSSSVTRGNKKSLGPGQRENQYEYEQLTMIELDGIRRCFIIGCQVSVAVLVLEHISSCFFIILEMILWILSEIWMVVRKMLHIRRSAQYYLR